MNAHDAIVERGHREPFGRGQRTGPALRTSPDDFGSPRLNQRLAGTKWALEPRVGARRASEVRPRRPQNLTARRIATAAWRGLATPVSA